MSTLINLVLNIRIAYAPLNCVFVPIPRYNITIQFNDLTKDEASKNKYCFALLQSINITINIYISNLNPTRN